MPSHFLLPYISATVRHPWEVQSRRIFHDFPLLPFQIFQWYDEPISETFFLMKSGTHSPRQVTCAIIIHSYNLKMLFQNKP